MSLLNYTTPTEDHAVLAANRILSDIPNTFRIIKNMWETGMRQLWDSDFSHAQTEDILLQLGTNGKEVFLLAKQMSDFLEAVEPGCTTETIQKYYKPVVFDPDGSVSLR